MSTSWCHDHAPSHPLLLPVSLFPSWLSLLLHPFIVAFCLLVQVESVVVVSSGGGGGGGRKLSGFDHSCWGLQIWSLPLLSPVVITCLSLIQLHIVYHLVHRHPIYSVHYHTHFILRIHISIACNYNYFIYLICSILLVQSLHSRSLIDVHHVVFEITYSCTTTPAPHISGTSGNPHFYWMSVHTKLLILYSWCIWTAEIIDPLYTW